LPPFEKVKLLGVNIDNVSVEDVLTLIEKTINSNDKARISYVNAHALNLCYEMPWFRDYMNASSLVFCDGYGVKWGALLTGQKIDHRFTPPDWIDLLCHQAVKQDWKLFFLGAKPGVAELAARKLQTSFPGLNIQTHHGYFDHFGPENEGVVLKINEYRPQIVIVGMGMPLQEKWIKENFEKLLFSNIFLPVGAMLDYLAGVTERGPGWLTDNGFEWLARLIIEPGRLGRRYLLGLPTFYIRLLLFKDSHKAAQNQE
jgi:N-acetylglucosaminyldiphosphoundecaprenol N-acetyl-beta-D-mannosaminyltransferase